MIIAPVPVFAMSESNTYLMITVVAVPLVSVAVACGNAWTRRIMDGIDTNNKKLDRNNVATNQVHELLNGKTTEATKLARESADDRQDAAVAEAHQESDLATARAQIPASLMEMLHRLDDQIKTSQTDRSALHGLVEKLSDRIDKLGDRIEQTKCPQSLSRDPTQPPDPQA